MTTPPPPCPVLVIDPGLEPPARLLALAPIDLAALDLVMTDRFLPRGSGLALPWPRHQQPDDRAESSDGRRSGYRLTLDAEPAHIPQVVAWLLRTTAAPLPEPQRWHLRGAFYELLLNAIEHGTLELGFQAKQRALAEGRYEAVLRQRLNEPRLKDRKVTIQVFAEPDVRRLTYRITDEGQGFMWRQRLMQSHDAGQGAAVSGRGIFLVRSFFPSLTYNDQGNEVAFSVPLTASYPLE